MERLLVYCQVCSKATALKGYLKKFFHMMNKLLLKKFSKFFVLHTKSIQDGGGLQVELSAMWVIVFVCSLNWGLYLSYRSSSVKILCL